MHTEWNQRTTLDKTLLALRMATSVGTVVCALLQLLGVWNRAINAAVPLMGLSLLFQSVQEWRQNRKTAILSLCVTLFVFACCIAALCGI